jgi:hypothetical protein
MMECQIEDLERLQRKSTQNQKDNFYILNYLIIISSYLYIKSYETCDSNKYNCDLYYDKFTLLYKLILIVASGFINAVILFISLLKFYKGKQFVLEAVVLFLGYLFINMFLNKRDTFEYTWILYVFSLVVFFIVLCLTQAIFQISLYALKICTNIKQLILLDFVIKLKLSFISHFINTLELI